jgi:hypothetical protein
VKKMFRLLFGFAAFLLFLALAGGAFPGLEIGTRILLAFLAAALAKNLIR